MRVPATANSFGEELFRAPRSQGARPSRTRDFVTGNLLRRLAFLLSCLTLCGAQAGELELRHQISGLNSQFSYTGRDFGEYVATSRAMIAATRTDLQGADADETVAGNSPFLLLPDATCPPGAPHAYRQGVLLTHGLTDSPYSMRYLARYFQSRCFVVYAILLPGHGTRPGDLLEVGWPDWTEAVKFGVTALAGSVDQVYLGGLSTGAALSVYHAGQDATIRGLFLFSPAIAVSSLAPVSCLLNGLGVLREKSRWLDLLPDEDTFKYESFAANAGCQIHKLTREIRPARSSKPVTIPLFIAASADDETVKIAATLELFKAASSTAKQMLLYGEELPSGADPAVELVPVRDPGARILGSAHTALVMAPADEHYGAAGAYRLCAIYFDKEPEAYRACKAGKADYLGEISAANRKLGVIQRLTFNPKFAHMLASLSAFLDRLESSEP